MRLDGKGDITYVSKLAEAVLGTKCVSMVYLSIFCSKFSTQTSLTLLAVIRCFR